MLQKKIINCLSIFLILILLYLFFKTNNLYHQLFNSVVYIKIWNQIFNKDFWTIMSFWFIFYWLSYWLYYIFWENNYGKPYYFWTAIWNILMFKSLDKTQISSLKNILVKIVFLPLMFLFFFSNLQSFISSLNNSISYLQNYINFYDFYIRHLHWLLFNLIFLFDVSIFLFWYSIESKRLNNQIKSVEPTFIWWAAALACYPIFNQLTNFIFNWYSSDLPDFVKIFGEQKIYLQLSFFWWVVFLLLMIVYVRASFALGFKASNLTNRWIVKSWPYKYMRHPAYVAKNLARLVWALPIIFYYISVNDYKTLWIVLFSLIWWLSIYHIRAITEENHLSKDPEYIKYKKEVPNKYIPFIN